MHGEGMPLREILSQKQPLSRKKSGYNPDKNRKISSTKLNQATSQKKQRQKLIFMFNFEFMN